MKLTSKLLLTACAAGLGLTPVSLTQAAEAKLYGSYLAALVNNNDRETDEGLQKDESYFDVTADTYSTNKLGVKFKLNDTVGGKVEMKMPSKAASPTMRKYYFNIKMAGWETIIGRHDRIYSEVAWAADNLWLGAAGGNVAGAVYSSRNEAVTIKSPALGPVTLAASLQQASRPGGNEGDADNAKQTESPALEGSINLELKAGSIGFGAGAAVHQETIGIGIDEEETAQAYTASAWVGSDMFKVAGAFVGGDPLFGNILDTATIVKGLDDTRTATMLWAEVHPIKDTTLALYWGSEKDIKKSHTKGVDDLEDQATSLGLHADYTWKDVSFFAEYTTLYRENNIKNPNDDAKDVRDADALGVGASISWGE